MNDVTSTACDRPTKKLPRKIQQLLSLSLALSLTAFAGCAGKETIREVTVYECHLEADLLKPTPVPPLNDATCGDLLSEADACRSALKTCNQDKQKLLRQVTSQLPKEAKP